MARRRRRARSNPSTGTWVAIGLGAAALGVGVYFLTRSSGTTNPATGQPIPAGDKLITVTVPGQPGQGQVLLSTACNAARQLRASGNTVDANTWAQICQQNGGTV
jgi:hypothetical protein